VPLRKVHNLMTDSQSLPPAAALPDYLHALTELVGYTLDSHCLLGLITDDPGAVIAWTNAAGRLMIADYQQRLLAAPITYLRTQIPEPGYDLEQITSFANGLAALLDKRRILADQMAQAREAFARACANVDQTSDYDAILAENTQWIEAELLCDLDQRTHTVKIPADTTGPWQRVRASASTVQSLADRHADQPAGRTTTQVRGRDDAFDLIIAHPDGHLTIRPLPSDNDGRYLLTGISWSRPGCAESRPHDTDDGQEPLEDSLSDAAPAAPGGSPPIALAEINTGNFTFHAFGATPEQARDALTAAWFQHVADTGAERDGFPHEDINVITGGYGHTFRDGSPYPRAVT